ncbi:winged helix-turn-helix domain-containing protein [Nonomuraea rubra]|uniref:OmpR/PhoB-type domain-containing protein n=1 Tax=Nonomuraea rubra TaxID=46180 RepID=A0A7X0NRV3_9ACTN|nr:hypothetical protein [Nonomuraea rubra]MBB6548478.1 hypothetical protein [Nonomuraea rubra]
MLLGNTVLCLDAHPEQQARLRADRASIPAAIEESLRLFTPFAALGRATTREVELGGVTIPGRPAGDVPARRGRPGSPPVHRPGGVRPGPRPRPPSGLRPRRPRSCALCGSTWPPATTRWRSPPTAPPRCARPPNGTPDLVSKTVSGGVRLAPTEWRILEILRRNPGKLSPQRYLLTEVWGRRHVKETHHLRQ